MIGKMALPVFISYDTVESGKSGGANSFVLGLKQVLGQSRDVVLVNKIASAKVVLIISAGYGDSKRLKPYMVRNTISGRTRWHPFGYFHAKKDKIIVQRLDGLGRLYGRNDDLDDRQININRYADITVFQTGYCKDVFRQAGINPERNVIIGNETNPGWFKPAAAHILDATIKIIGCSWSNNPNKGFEDLVDWAKLRHVEVSFVGRWPERIHSGKVRLLGVMHQKDFAQVLKQNDLLLYPSKNDACPNVVYEALASGLPVVYHPSGGTPEICRNTMFGEPMSDTPQKTLEKILDRYHEIRERVSDHYSEFLITYAAKKYEKIFLEAARL